MVYDALWFIAFTCTKLTAWNVGLLFLVLIWQQFVYPNPFRSFVRHYYWLYVDIFYLTKRISVITTVLYYVFYIFWFDAIAPRYPLYNPIALFMVEHVVHVLPTIIMFTRQPYSYITCTPQPKMKPYINACNYFEVTLILYQFIFYCITGVPAYPFLKQIYDFIL